MNTSGGVLGYAIAAIAFLWLALLLLFRWRVRARGSFLAPACLTTSVWAGVLALQGALAFPPVTAIFAIEFVRDSAWIAFLARVLSTTSTTQVQRRIAWWVFSALTVLLLSGLALGALRDAGAVDSGGRLLIPCALLLAIVGIILTHQAHRNTRRTHRWALKYAWFAIGALFAYDLFMYSRSLMFHELDAEAWHARGAANALVVPLLAIGIGRTENLAPGTFMSNRFTFYAMSFVGVGGYLLLMALVGYYVRGVGGTWGGAAQILFLFGALVLLAILLFSGQARAWVRVVLAKHLLPYRYDYRVEWRRLTQVLSAPDTEASLEERAVQALARIVHADGGGIWICRDGKRFDPSGGHLAGPDVPSIDANAAFLQHMVEREWIVDLDVERRVRSAADLPTWLLENPRVRLLVPLLQEQTLVGIVGLNPPLTPYTLQWEGLDLLRAAGRQIGSCVALKIAGTLLAQSQQFEAYNRLTAFIMHDLKNLVAQQRLVVDNAGRHKDKPQFGEDAIATIENSVRRMNRLLDQLRRGETLGPTRAVSVAEVFHSVARQCSDRRPVPSVHVSDAQLQVVVSPDRFALVLEHLVRNAQDATPPEGTVRMEVRREAANAVIEVCDTGRGMEPTFVRERLFRPFDTTKGSQGMGIGAFQAREFARLSGGEVAVCSEPGRGTRFSILLPAAAPMCELALSEE
jgi:putative PEP-CTERM system histidine kinase